VPEAEGMAEIDAAVAGVVLDTHGLLSGLAYPDSFPGRLIAAWCHGSLDVGLSDPILEDLRRTRPHPAETDPSARIAVAAGCKKLPMVDLESG
jgi:hypothetical protein